MLFEKISLEPNEEVLKVVRKHWFVILAELLGIVFMLLFPFVLLFILVLFPEPLRELTLSIPHYTSLLVFLSAIWMLLSLLIGFMLWTHYYLDLWIITDRRIIAIDQVHFFNRSISVFRLERLQDIEIKVSGLIQTFLDFGTISAQTGGHFEQNFKQTGMPDPRALQALIQQAMDERLRELQGVNPNLYL